MCLLYSPAAASVSDSPCEHELQRWGFLSLFHPWVTAHRYPVLLLCLGSTPECMSSAMADLCLMSPPILRVSELPTPPLVRIGLISPQCGAGILSLLIPTTANLCLDPGVWSAFLPIPCLYDSVCVPRQERWDTGGFCVCLPGASIITPMLAPSRGSVLSCPIRNLPLSMVEADGKKWQVDTHPL